MDFLATIKAPDISHLQSNDNSSVEDYSNFDTTHEIGIGIIVAFGVFYCLVLAGMSLLFSAGIGAVIGCVMGEYIHVKHKERNRLFEEERAELVSKANQFR